MMQRRGLILAALAAPFVARTPGLLMPVRPVRPMSRIVPLMLDLWPALPSPGACYFDTAFGEIRTWDGARWLPSTPLDRFAA